MLKFSHKSDIEVSCEQNSDEILILVKSSLSLGTLMKLFEKNFILKSDFFIICDVSYLCKYR